MFGRFGQTNVYVIGEIQSQTPAFLDERVGRVGQGGAGRGVRSVLAGATSKNASFREIVERGRPEKKQGRNLP